MASESQRKAAQAALKKIADAISENQGRARILQGGENAAAKKASGMSDQIKKGNAEYDYRVAKADLESPNGFPFDTPLQRYGKSKDPYWKNRYHEALGWEKLQKEPLAAFGKADAAEVQKVRARGEKISARKAGIEAQNEALSKKASDISMTEREHFGKVLSDMKSRREKGISTEYADNLVIQGRGTPPVDIMPKTPKQEANLAAGTILAAGAAGGAGYISSWTKKKQSDQNGQK